MWVVLVQGHCPDLQASDSSTGSNEGLIPHMEDSTDSRPEASALRSEALSLAAQCCGLNPPEQVNLRRVKRKLTPTFR